MVFSEALSLGAENVGCEIGFALRDHLGFDNAHFWNWRAAEPPVLLNVLRARFVGIMRDRYISRWYGVAREMPYGIQYHPGTSIEDDRAKAAHMVKRFYAPTGPRLYIRKQYEDVREDWVEEVCRHLSQISDEYLLVILRERGRSQGFQMPQVAERELSFFAPGADARQRDHASWAKLFDEFRVVQPADA